MLDSVDLSDDVEPATGPRIPPPVHPQQNAPLRRDTQPSVSIEQAAKPSFDITVGDPHKVGDLTSSHIVYLVRTKVWFMASGSSMGRANLDTDFIQGLPSTRIRCYEKISRLPMAL